MALGGNARQHRQRCRQGRGGGSRSTAAAAAATRGYGVDLDRLGSRCRGGCRAGGRGQPPRGGGRRQRRRGHRLSCRCRCGGGRRGSERPRQTRSCAFRISPGTKQKSEGERRARVGGHELLRRITWAQEHRNKQDSLCECGRLHQETSTCSHAKCFFARGRPSTAAAKLQKTAA